MKHATYIGVVCVTSILAFGGSAAQATTYIYDGQGRLKSVITDDNKQATYTLDDASNRTQVAGVGPSQKNRAPKAHDRTFSVPTTGTKQFNPITNAVPDTDPEGQAIHVVGITQGQLGVVTRSGDSITYTANSKRTTAQDSFTYTIQDTGGLTDSGVTTMVLTSVPPTAVNDTYGTIPRNIPYELSPSPLDNDHDADGNVGSGTLSIVGVGAGSGGTVTFNYNTITYTPASGTTGAKSFTYTIQDQDGLQAQATIHITVDSTNHAPEVNWNGTTDSTFVFIGRYVDFNPTKNDRDQDHDAFKLTITTPPSHGHACVLTGGGTGCNTLGGSYGDDTIRYSTTLTDNGTDTLVYKLTDPLGAESGFSTVTIQVEKLEGGQ